MEPVPHIGFHWGSNTLGTMFPMPWDKEKRVREVQAVSKTTVFLLRLQIRNAIEASRLAGQDSSGNQHSLPAVHDHRRESEGDPSESEEGRKVIVRSDDRKRTGEVE